MSSHHTSVLVVGGGIAGTTAAVEAAELGHEVYLVEKSPTLGGRVAGMNKYFQNCALRTAVLKSTTVASRKIPRSASLRCPKSRKSRENPEITR